ncbi:MAG: 4'-phosphopantetheinyl transferase superfamily protein [Brevundimonas sp.]|nr:MAG: 4'-phosphopantetheinyl transferase superfamily protein [Brevundimonas sp.]
MPSAQVATAEPFRDDAAFEVDVAGQPYRVAFAILIGGHLDVAEGVLSEAETALLPSVRYERRRRTLMAGRTTAKAALARLAPGTGPQHVSVIPGVFGQPVVTGPSLEGLQVSISHAGDTTIAMAFPEACPFGVDMERVEARHRDALLRHTSERELERIGAFHDEDVGLTAAWTLREALSKALRCGLTTPPLLLETTQLTLDEAGYHCAYGNFGQYAGAGVFTASVCASVTAPRRVRWSAGEAYRETLGAWLHRSGSAARVSAT